MNIFIKLFDLAGDQQEPNKDQKPNKIKEEKEASGFLVGGAGFIPTSLVITALLRAPVTLDIDQKFNQTERKIEHIAKIGTTQKLKHE